MNFSSSRPYSRLEIDKEFTKVKATMHAEAMIRGNGRASYRDCYTGKPLIGGEDYDYEHIYSSEWVHSTYKHLLTDEQIAKVANCPENVGVTLRVINQSKGKNHPETWLATPHHMRNNDIDLPYALANVKRAKAGIERMVAILSGK